MTAIYNSVGFVIQGRPQGKARPRVTKYGAYTPKKTKEYEKAAALAYKLAGGEEFKGAVLMEIIAYFKIPDSYSKKRAASVREKAYPHRPDCDNIAKIICDALNGIAYKDDGQVVRLNVTKLYTDEEERTEVYITGT